MVTKLVIRTIGLGHPLDYILVSNGITRRDLRRNGGDETQVSKSSIGD